MSVIRWEEPPPHGNTGQRKPRLNAVADELRRNPGTWAVIAEAIPLGTAGGKVARIRAGRGAWGPKGSFEARCVGPAGGLGSVYVRYVGGAS